MQVIDEAGADIDALRSEIAGIVAVEIKGWTLQRLCLHRREMHRYLERYCVGRAAPDRQTSPSKAVACLLLLLGEEPITGRAYEAVRMLAEAQYERIIPTRSAPGRNDWELTKDSLNSLMAYVAAIEPDLSPATVVPGQMLLITQLLAAKLADSCLLDSRSYRLRLWRALDNVTLRELLRPKHQELFSGDPVPMGDSAESLLLDVWLVAEYGYEVLGVDRQLRVYEHFETAMRREMLLYFGKDGYRDHLRHSLNTFLLGHALMANGARIWRQSRDQSLMRQWLIAALYHDLGYIMDLFPMMFDLGQGFDSRNVTGIIESLRAQWHDQLTTLNRDAIAECHLQSDLGTRCDHGLFSYVHLRNALLQIDWGLAPKEDDVTHEHSESCELYRQALDAILVHNMHREPIFTTRQPLSALLAVCDEIQDWLRPRYHGRDLAVAGVSMVHGWGLDGALIDRQTTDSVTVDKQGGVTRVVVTMADQNRHRFEPVCRLLGAIHNWERIHEIAKTALCVEFRLHRLSSNGDSSTDAISEIEILREFCLATGNAWVSPDVHTLHKNAAIAADQRCTYYQQTIDRTCSMDVIVVNFLKFPDDPRRRDPLVRRPAWDIELAFREFKTDYCNKHGLPLLTEGDALWAMAHTSPL
ncbi:MAG TPA: hypothetical protein ENH80_15355 [Phycisphaerae bacterium]|nr:hypothetical protein [Phycisphaerae bacterium]HDZ45306.1 hypothetical protein [Phycisphaerae bacterium]